MKNIIKKLMKRGGLVAAACGILTLGQGSALAQSWSIPNPYNTNDATWLPQPQTNVVLGLPFFLAAHSIQVQNFNLAATNNVTNKFFISIDATNKIPYYIATVNGVTGNYGNTYVPTGTNATDTIVFAPTNVPVYGASSVAVGTNATTSKAAQLISPLY